MDAEMVRISELMAAEKFTIKTVVEVSQANRQGKKTRRLNVFSTT